MRAGLLILATLACGPLAAETLERRTAADPAGEVTISNVAGEVQVRGWERAEVAVEGDLGQGVERLELERDGPRTSVRVVLPKGRRSAGGSLLTVRVPRGSALSINSVSADQSVREVRGVQRLQSVSGTIETESWEEVEIKTASGDVQVTGRGKPAPVRVTTVSGDVRLEGLRGELELNTVTGDMFVQAGELSRVRIKTTNGDLDLAAALAPEARLEAEAINGDLTFELRGRVDAEFDIETFHGDIDACFGPEARRSRQFAPGNELRFREGDGRGRVRIKTLNGDVTLCKK